MENDSWVASIAAFIGLVTPVTLLVWFLCWRKRSKDMNKKPVGWKWLPLVLLALIIDTLVVFALAFATGDLQGKYASGFMITGGVIAYFAINAILAKIP